MSHAAPWSNPPFAPATYAARRSRYMEAIGKHAVAIVRSPPESRRNGNINYPFRQSSDLYYLTGFAEPEATLVLRPGADTEQVVMFVRPKDAETETWHGRRAGVEGVKQHYGADAAYPIAELDSRLPDLVANVDQFFYSLGLDPEFDRVMLSVIAGLRTTERLGKRPPRSVVDPRVALHEMRLRKTPEELEVIRQAVAISGEAHVEAMKMARPGVAEYQLAAHIEYVFRKNGGTGPGYNTIVGTGENNTILHYIDHTSVIAAKDLILIDAGCEYQSYTADITRTFPADPRFTEPQRRCYQLVLATQKAAIAMVRPGVTIDEIHGFCVEQLTAGMVHLGLLEGPPQDRIEDETYKHFYMHRTSHWLGMDVHDVGAYTRNGESRPLEPGMLITVEPGLYISASAENVPEELRGIGIRIEDDILVTDTGHENLTAAVPKEIDEIEAIRA